MKEDFLKELKYLGFTARLKRMSDTLIYNTRSLYKDLDLGIEPNWHLIFLLLKKQGKLSVTELSEMLQLSHPAIIKIIAKMKKSGFIESNTDINDTRKQLLSLSQRALELLPKFEAEWNNVSKALEEVIPLEFFDLMDQIEEEFDTISFNDRHDNLIHKIKDKNE